MPLRSVTAIVPTTAPSHSDATPAAQTLLARGRSLCHRAGHLLVPILINSVLSVAVAWLAALCYSLGNIFVRPTHQSPRVFLVATLLWIHVFFCCTVWLGRSVSLFRLHLLTHPHRRAGVCRMLWKMLRRTVGWFLLSAFALAVIGFGFGSLDARWRKYRFELYASSFWYYSFLPKADRAARAIYKRETVEGRQQQLQQQQPVRPIPTRTPPRRCWLWGYNGFVFGTFLLSIVYVHTISFVGVVASTRFAAALTVVSLALKIAIQEAAKVFILKSQIRNARVMALLVAVPTVLIDTQVRIVLLRFQSVHLALSTTLALALGEIATRVAKAKWLQRQIHRREEQSPVAVHPETPLDQQHERDKLHAWRTLLHQYHATELCADMYAEYLAIGCSSAITVVFGGHPQFLLPRSTTAGSTSVVAPLLAQVAVEMVVDFCACVAELASGMELPGERERTYFVVFFAALAIVNVNTSAILYLAY